MIESFRASISAFVRLVFFCFVDLDLLTIFSKRLPVGLVRVDSPKNKKMRTLLHATLLALNFGGSSRHVRMCRIFRSSSSGDNGGAQRSAFICRMRYLINSWSAPAAFKLRP